MKKGSVVIFIIIILLALRDHVPFISNQVPLVASLALYAIAFIALITDRGMAPFAKYAPLFAIPIMDLVYSIFDASDGSFASLGYGFMQTFIWAFVCDYILNHKGGKYNKTLYVLIFIMVIVTAITTYLGCQLMPGASRNLATGLMDDPELKVAYANLNIGGFGFIYMLVLLIPLLLFILRFLSPTLIKKIAILAIVILFVATVYISEYSTAILITFLTVSILFLPPKLTIRKSFVWFIGIAIVGVALASIIPALFFEFARLTDSYDVSIRMEEVGSMMSGQQTSGDVQGRVDIWSTSWKNFLSSPLFGTGNRGGGHSFILDHMSKYGFWGLFLIYLQFHSLYKLIVKPYLRTNFSTLFVFIFVLSVTLCLINTYFIHSVFLFFIPLFISQYENQDIHYIKKRQ